MFRLRKHMKTLIFVSTLMLAGPIMSLEAAGQWLADSWSLGYAPVCNEVHIHEYDPQTGTEVTKDFVVRKFTGGGGPILGTSVASWGGECDVSSTVYAEAGDGHSGGGDLDRGCGFGGDVCFIWDSDGDPSPGIYLEWSFNGSGSIDIMGGANEYGDGDGYGYAGSFGHSTGGGGPWASGADSGGGTCWAVGVDRTDTGTETDEDAHHEPGGSSSASSGSSGNGYTGSGSWSWEGQGTYSSAPGVTSVWASGGGGCTTHSKAEASGPQNSSGDGSATATAIAEGSSYFEASSL